MKKKIFLAAMLGIALALAASVTGCISDDTAYRIGYDIGSSW